MTRRLLSGAALLALATAACAAEDAPAPRVHAPPAALLERPDTPGNDIQFRFEPGDVVETHGSPGGEFLIHFTRQGPNAVPAADADGSGVPDFVEEVAGVYDEVLAHYAGTLGFRTPPSDAAIADNGGDGRFDVYLVDFGGIGDGNFLVDGCGPDSAEICAGFMIQENDYVGYGYPSTLLANRILGSHEFFHAVQAAYDTGQGSVFSEGTAVWATESFDPSLDDFEYFLDGYLENPDRSIDQGLPGPVDPFSYGTAIFFRFLEERYGDGAVRALWERTPNGPGGATDPIWLEEIEPMLEERAQTSFAEAFVEFATWNLFTGSRADPSRGYANGADYPLVDMTNVTAPFSDDALRVFYASTQYYRATPDGRAQMTAALVPPADAPEEIADLTLLLAVLRSTGWDPVVRVSDPAAGAEVVDTAGAERFVAIVVNGARSGDSSRPALCLGAPDEVAACRATFGGDPGSTSGDPPPPPAESADAGGCGCRAGAAPAPRSAAAALGLLGVGLALRLGQRRRRARRAP